MKSWIKKIAERILSKEIKSLEQRASIAESEKLIAQSRLQTTAGDPREVVKQIFGKDISWFDYTELPDEQRTTYYNEAQMILKGVILENEMNYLKATGAQAALEYAAGDDQKVARAVRDFQMTLNGYELFRDRLLEISKPPTKPTVDPTAKHNPI